MTAIPPSPRRLVSLAALGLLCLLAASLRADAADDLKAIIEKSIQAHGGLDNLKKLQMVSGKVKGTVMVNGMPVAFTGEILIQLPDKFKNKATVNLNGMKLDFLEVLNGDKAWLTVMGMTMVVEGEQLKSMKETAYANTVEMLVPLQTEKQFKLAALPEAKVDGKPALGVKVSSKGHKDIELYFDKTSFLLVRVVRPSYDSAAMKEVTNETTYQDFKDFSGIKQPSKAVIKYDGQKQEEFELLELKLLDKIDPNEFAKTL